MGQETRWDEATQEEVDVGWAVDNSYVAHLGDPEEFGERVWAEAKRRGWTRAADSEVIGDGAVRICTWNLTGEHFYDSEQIVDWYHAKQHLVHAGQLLHEEGTPQVDRWLGEQETRLYQGHAAEIAEQLHQAGASHPVEKDALQTEAAILPTTTNGWTISKCVSKAG